MEAALLALAILGALAWLAISGEPPERAGAAHAATAPAASPAPDTNVSVRILSRKPKLKVKRGKGRLAVKLRCPKDEVSPPCSGRLDLAMPGKSARRLGGRNFSIGAGRARLVTVRLGRAKLRHLRRHGKPTLRLRATASVRDRAGNRGEARARLQVKPLAGVTIAINAGHNGRNWSQPGRINRMVPIGSGQVKACDTTGTSTNGGYTESAFNLAVSRELRRWLRRRGARVVMVRSSDNGVGPCIDERARIANRSGADAAISIHADGGPPGGRGFHIIRPTRIAGLTGPIYKPSQQLAEALRGGLDKTPLPRSNYAGSQGIHPRSDIGGLRLSKVPAVLVEIANMRNSRDAAYISSAAGRRQIAAALGAGIQRYLAR